MRAEAVGDGTLLVAVEHEYDGRALRDAIELPQRPSLFPSRWDFGLLLSYGLGFPTATFPRASHDSTRAIFLFLLTTLVHDSRRRSTFFSLRLHCDVLVQTRQFVAPLSACRRASTPAGAAGLAQSPRPGAGLPESTRSYRLFARFIALAIPPTTLRQSSSFAGRLTGRYPREGIGVRSGAATLTFAQRFFAQADGANGASQLGFCPCGKSELSAPATPLFPANHADLFLA